MKEYYIHIFKNNSVLLSNLPEELREEADRCSCNLTNSMCPIRHVMKRRNKEIITDGYIYMCSYDTSITNKIFLHYFDMLRSVHIAYEEKIKNEKEDGSVERWLDDDELIEDYGNDYYEAYLDGYYSSSHYLVDITSHSVSVNDSVVSDFANAYISKSRVEDFVSQIEQWDEV